MSQASIERSGAGRGTIKSYVTGFGLSIILTVIAFGVALSGSFSFFMTLGVIFIAGAAQILTHLHFFLHLDSSSAERWNVLALIFTVLIMVLFVGGTIWIMHSLYHRMM